MKTKTSLFLIFFAFQTVFAKEDGVNFCSTETKEDKLSMLEKMVTDAKELSTIDSLCKQIKNCFEYEEEEYEKEYEEEYGEDYEEEDEEDYEEDLDELCYSEEDFEDDELYNPGFDSYPQCKKYLSVKSNAKDECGLNKRQDFIMEEYVGSLYSCLNKRLYSGKEEKVSTIQKSLDEAIGALPVYEGLVFRGSVLPQNILAQHKLGKTVTYKSFTSTSMERSTSESFGEGGTLFLIYSKNGRITDNEGEREILFKSGAKFKVIHSYQDKIIMREVNNTSDANNINEDKRILDLARSAVKFESDQMDEWTQCSVKAEQSIDRVKQKVLPSTKGFFP